MSHLYYSKFGKGVPLLILHGLFGSSSNWMGLAKRWAEHFEVYAIDLRNHGRSFHDAEHSYPALSRDIYEFIREYRLEKVHVLGHSMGGKTAIQLAHDHTELIHKLVVVDIAPKPYPPQHEEILAGLDAVKRTSCLDRAHADRILAEFVQDQATRLFLLKSLKCGPEGCHWMMHVDSLRENYGEIAKAPQLSHIISTPTLFIRGANSDYIQTEDESLLATHFSECDVSSIQGAGHWVHAQAPDKVFDLVLDFFS